MPHPLERKMAQLARRLRALLLLYGLGWAIAAAVLAIVLLGLADYLIRFQDRGVRAISTAAALVACGWAMRRFLWPALTARWTTVRLAQRAEKRFPGLTDRLASTMYFLAQPEGDETAGSAALRRAVVHQTTIEAAELDLNDALDSRPTRHALAAAAGVCALALALALLSPVSARVALVRLARPWGDDAWPQQHHLAFRNPVHRIASGQMFEVEVIDTRGAGLPEIVWIEYRSISANGEVAEQRQRADRLGETVVARRENVLRSFDYRAVGGDDDSMPWTHAEVLDPPVVERLTVELHYPPYTGWPSQVGDKQIRAIAGTRIGLSGAVTKPLRRATLHREGAEPVPLVLSADLHGFSLAPTAEPGFVVEQTGAYWFELVDNDGLLGGTELKYEMRAIPDSPPTIAIEEPPTDLHLTSRAAVPLKVVAKDDLAVAAISRLVDRSDQSDRDSQRSILFEGPPQISPVKAGPPAISDQGDVRVVEERWNLEPLDLKPGTQLTIRASARDYRPAESTSPPRRITIITNEELDDRLAERQSFLATELARLLKLEQEARGQVRALDIQAREVGKLEPADLDRLQNAEMTQRQVARSLTSKTDGVRGRAEGLLAEMTNNRVENADVEQRMRALADEIDRLAREPLPAIESELTAARKEAQAASAESGASPQAASAKVQPALEAAGAKQDEVIGSLERQLAALAEWNSFRQFHRDLAQLRREQERVTAETARTGRETLAHRAEDLTPQQRADLQKIAEDQQALARQLEKIQQQMRQATQQMPAGDPAADVIADALSQSQQANLSQELREAGKNVGANQIGQAAARQNKALEQLREMLDTLANRREQSLERLVEKLRAAENELAEMRKQQAGLRKRIEQAAAEADPEERRRQLERLAREERRLQEEADRLARRLERLQANTAAGATRSASSSLGKADQAGSQGESEQATAAARQAEKDLAQAQADVAQRRRQAEIDLAFEQLAKMQDTLTGLHARQQEVVQEAARIEELRQQQERLSRGQAESVHQMARDQRQISAEAGTLGEKLAAAEAFALVLRHAADDMIRAAEQFDQLHTDATAQAAARQAARRLELLLAALEADAVAGDQQDKPEEEGNAGGDAEGKPQPPEDGIAEIAQLKLIKLMQEEINRRTRELDESLGSKSALSAEEQRQYTQLGAEQGQLADLLSNLTPVTEHDIEADPERLPDVRTGDTTGGENEPGNSQQDESKESTP